MFLYELTCDQLDELRQHLCFEFAEYEGRTPSFDEIARAGETYNDAELMQYYDGVSFTDDDFTSPSAPAAGPAVRAFVAGALLADPDPGHMLPGYAEIALKEWRAEGVELPDMDAETLRIEWNRQLDADRNA